MDGLLQVEVLRDRLRLIVATTIGVAVVTFAVLTTVPKTYEAQTRLLVGHIVLAQNPSIDDLLLAKELASAYAVLATTRPVAEKVIADLHLDTTPDKLLENQISSYPGLDTPYVTILARAGTPTLAAQLANAVAAQVEELAPTEVTSGITGVTTSLIKVVEPAVPPVEPASPRVVLFTLLGLIAGAAIGVALAFGREFAHPRVRTVATIARLTGLRTLGVIPPGRRGRRSNDPWNELRAEFIALRANLLGGSPDGGEPRSILLTSPRTGDGATAAATGLAVAWAAAGYRVIFIPIPGGEGGASATGARAREAASAAASREGGREPLLRTTRNHRIHILQGGLAAAASGSRTERMELADMVTKLSANADLVIVDGPAALDGLEAVSLGAAVDLAVLVVDLKTTLRRDLEMATSTLIRAGVHVAGTVAYRPSLSGWWDADGSEPGYGPALDRIAAEARTSAPASGQGRP